MSYYQGRRVGMGNPATRQASCIIFKTWIADLILATFEKAQHSTSAISRSVEVIAPVKTLDLGVVSGVLVKYFSTTLMMKL